MQTNDLTSTDKDTANVLALKALRKTDLPISYLDASEGFEAELGKLHDSHQIANNRGI
jgi:hypothetical protein